MTLFSPSARAAVVAVFGILAGIAPCVRAQTVFLNELHYDNNGTDEGEGVEIAGLAGTDLSGFDVVFYNGNGGAVYHTLSLTGNLPNEAGTGFGAKWFPVSGIQNGAPDGLVLVHRSDGAVLQALAYEGSFTAVGGPANGLVLPDIGVSEPESGNPAGRSLQLSGTGTTAAQFAWTGPATASPGLINAGQTFGSPPPVSVLSFAPGLIREGESATATLSVSPLPLSPVTFLLSTAPADRSGGIVLPGSVLVPLSGSVTFSVSAVADGVADGFQDAAVLATPGNLTYPPAGAALQVVDADRPSRSAPGVFRVMTLNVRLGIGGPGSPEFAAVREVVERISPDVLLMQEVSDAGDFGDARMLLEQAGFPTGAAGVSAVDDNFTGQPYSSGDFGTGVCLITASRFPVTRSVQIGRGVAGRKELTRFPLFTTIDLPGPDDLHVVNLHLKAGTEDTDRFRKAVESYRIREFLAAQSLTAATDNVVVAGDFNAIDTIFLPALSYNTSSYTPPAGTSLPVSFLLGSDLSASPGVTLPYSVPPFNPASSVYPHQGFNPAGLFAPVLFQADGVSGSTFNLFDARFDYIFVPQRLLISGSVVGEVYSSRLESQADGLPKRPGLPAPALSETASDHNAVFADLQLSPQPSLSLTITPAERDESSTAAPPVAVVRLNPAPAAPVTVTLDSWRDGRISPGSRTVLLTPGQPTAGVPVLVPFSPLVEPRRAVSLRATAPGYQPAFAALTVTGGEAAGLLVFSQYIEPPASAVPPDSNTSRALEICNASGEAMDLARLQWRVLRYTNGSTSPAIVGRVSAVVPDNTHAWLPAGQVVVVGDAAIGAALVTAGLLPNPSSPTFSSADTGTLFCNGSGQPVFLKGSNMDFNGDDALEITADGLRCDVFGTIGQDPGAAWTGGPDNPSTADQNLSLRPEILTGSTGFTQPGHRFLTTASGSSLSGLGLPPVPADAYLAWAAAHGLSGLELAPNRDPDSDGRLNLLEFVQQTDPVLADAAPAVIFTESTASALTLPPDPWLSLSWEHLSGPGLWEPAPEISAAAEGALTRWTWSLPQPSTLRLFWRLRASRP